MEKIYESAVEARKRYANIRSEFRKELVLQILETVDAQIDQVLKIWMDEFAEYYDSELFQELYNWRFKK